MTSDEITNEELLAIAVKIENDGKVFYTLAADQVADPRVKAFLLQMAGEESLHEWQFKKILEEKGAQEYGWERKKGARDAVLKQFQTDIFPPAADLARLSSDLKKIEKVLDFALEVEKVSAGFYKLLGEYCEDTGAKTELLLLEKAELEHAQRIEDLRRQYLR